MQKMQKCKKLKSTQKCKLKNKIGHQLLVQKSELGRGLRDFRPCYNFDILGNFTYIFKQVVKTNMSIHQLANRIKFRFYIGPCFLIFSNIMYLKDFIEQYEMIKNMMSMFRELLLPLQLLWASIHITRVIRLM